MPGVGPHSGYLLRLFGAHVAQAFGAPAYQVGSSLTKRRRFRDVDVRVMLDEEQFIAYADPNVRRLHELAWTALGEKMTGLPIDLQIQLQSAANRDHPGPRSALLITELELTFVRNF